MKMNEMFPSKYLRADDLANGPQVLTIRQDVLEAVDPTNSQKLKPVLYFDEIEKGLVLNQTNATTLLEITGSDDSADWIGFQVEAFKTKTQFQGRLTDCLRLRQAPTSTPFD